MRGQKQEIVSEINLASKAAEKKVPDFKFQSNKILFEFNADRENDITKAINLLNNRKVDLSVEVLNSTLKQLNKRNKIDKYGRAFV